MCSSFLNKEEPSFFYQNETLVVVVSEREEHFMIHGMTGTRLAYSNRNDVSHDHGDDDDYDYNALMFCMSYSRRSHLHREEFG